MNSEERPELVLLQGVKYAVVRETRIRAHLFDKLMPEWGKEEFEEELPEMEGWIWRAERVKISAIKLWDAVMRDPQFIAELEKRVMTQKDRISRGEGIEPIVVRGGDMVIYDGYARLHALKQLGKDEVLTYVGR
jgi:hypothetical protein